MQTTSSHSQTNAVRITEGKEELAVRVCDRERGVTTARGLEPGRSLRGAPELGWGSLAEPCALTQGPGPLGGDGAGTVGLPCCVHASLFTCVFYTFCTQVHYQISSPILGCVFISSTIHTYIFFKSVTTFRAVSGLQET